MNLGIALKSLGKYQEAIVCFEKAIKIQPENIRSYNILGRILKELGEYNKAIIYYEKSIKINPDNFMTVNGILEMFTTIQFSNLTKKNSKSIKNLIIFLLKKNNINHSQIFHNVKLF